MCFLHDQGVHTLPSQLELFFTHPTSRIEWTDFVVAAMSASVFDDYVARSTTLQMLRLHCEYVDSLVVEALGRAVTGALKLMHLSITMDSVHGQEMQMLLGTQAGGYGRR